MVSFGLLIPHHLPVACYTALTLPSLSQPHPCPPPLQTIVILAKYSAGTAMAHCVITITTMLFVYISLLVRDVDDPFHYSAGEYLDGVVVAVV